MNTPDTNVWVRNMIESLGGTYVGIQQPLDPTEESCVMFTRVNSTQLLSLPLSKFGHDTVRDRLGKNVTSFQKVERVDFTRIRTLLAQLRDDANRMINLADVIEEELKNV